jgi:hypothetical protein
MAAELKVDLLKSSVVSNLEIARKHCTVSQHTLNYPGYFIASEMLQASSFMATNLF